MRPSEWKRAFEHQGVLTGEERAGGEFPAYCPSCEDPDESKSPSASFNFKKGKFYCHSCRNPAKLTFPELLDIAKDNSYVAREEKRKEGKPGKKKSDGEKTKEPLPSHDQIAEWVANLWSKKYKDSLQAFMDKRGISAETLEKFNVGYDPERRRFTLPVYDIAGQLVNVRSYSLRKSTTAKMVNWLGHGEARLFNMGALSESEIFLVEGEWDCLIAVDRGLNAITWTSGVSSWQSKFNTAFEGKTVFICFDDDEQGKIGARRVAHELRNVVDQVYVVDLTIPSIKGGDLTDYFHSLGHSIGDFEDLVRDARETDVGLVTRKSKRERMDQVQEVSVESSYDPAYHGQTLRIVGTVSGKGSSPYPAPKKVDFSCDQGWGDKCKNCVMSIYAGRKTIEFETSDEGIIDFVDKPKAQARKLRLEMAGIPQNCPRVDMETEEVHSIEVLQVMPSIENRSTEVVNPVDRTVYNIGTHDLQLNKTYEFEGTSMPSPTDGSSIFHSWSYKPVEVDIERFQMDEVIKKQLEIFQPDEAWGQSPWDKLKEIAYDMSINVTSIYGRPELHIGYDLVWHSVSSFYFGGRLQQRGWTECMVIGDTRTGKSEAANRLANHYRSGIVVDCENTSLAGLIGGSSQRGASKQWGITWGIIPLNDKRMVVLDEAGGIKPETISAMSSVRSQGIAEVNKMGGQKTSARTRLVWIANPRSATPINEMANGAMDEFENLIPTPEDIARFDFAMAAASDDVSMDMIAAERDEHADHMHHSEDCKLLLTWCWSRKPEQIIFLGDTEQYIYDKTRRFAARYVEKVPLVQKQSFHLKLARLSAAVAARLFSTDESGENVLVGREHVDTALHFLDLVYGMDSFGYRQFSNRQILEAQRARNNMRRARSYILGSDPVMNTLLRVLGHDKFKNRDFEERGGMMREEAAMAVDELIDLGMLRSMSRGDLKMTKELKDLMLEIRRERDQELNLEAEENAEDY